MDQSRRDLLKKSLYIVPVVLTAGVDMSFARGAYCNRKGNNGVGNGLDPQPPGNPPPNDLFGTGPGFPGNRGGSWR